MNKKELESLIRDIRNEAKARKSSETWQVKAWEKAQG